ncbi:putative secreted RxLR effector protein [Phytophthora cinnamomi]|uniref:putative secreted RxLR effector protein n=1 Tax=Phytophthora cinnamomi TaxID=4785 RepID=UPI0035597E39|nr:putative secreted RxLR effector protein [Phytophthora cinnamomi]
MRLSYALLVALVTFLASSDAVSSVTTNTLSKDPTTRQRHLRSYNMDNLENEGEERFIFNSISNIAPRVRAESPTLNVDAILRTYTREEELNRIALHFENNDGALGAVRQKYSQEYRYVAFLYEGYLHRLS